MKRRKAGIVQSSVVYVDEPKLKKFSGVPDFLLYLAGLMGLHESREIRPVQTSRDTDLFMRLCLSRIRDVTRTITS